MIENYITPRTNKIPPHLGCALVYLQLNGIPGPIHGSVCMPLGVYGLSTNWLNGNTHLGVNMFACKPYVVIFLLGRLLIDHERIIHHWASRSEYCSLHEVSIWFSK